MRLAVYKQPTTVHTKNVPDLASLSFLSESSLSSTPSDFLSVDRQSVFEAQTRWN
jgi:hypothetical protein